jgi:uncharacterized membrane protein
VSDCSGGAYACVIKAQAPLAAVLFVLQVALMYVWAF